jgi:NADH-quinone oxidoreductase subunit L
MDYAISLALFLPLVGFILLGLGAWKLPRKAVSCIGCSSVGLSFMTFSLCLLWALYSGQHQFYVDIYSWIPVEGIDAAFALNLDPLSIVMCLVVTGVGFLIHIYSCEYIEHEDDYARYFACLNFFVFCMLLLVLAADMVVLFMGWEGVGLASYLLIGYWYQKNAAAKAATKAFVVNRIGDFAFLLGLLYTFKLFGTSSMSVIFDTAEQQFPIGSADMNILTALFFIGAIGKSAQIPLHIWLPDAMEGPTPVSALIHAATMVTAGVYMVVRLNPLFDLAPLTLTAVGIIGGVTALFAALCAIGQTDLKRVLAYSTVSQLGFMFLACGVAAYYAAIFHLITHAFMKALLFLAAGNVVHMLGGKTEMSEMGGLSKIFKTTHVCFLIGVLAMAGIPPLAAFFSKDLILEQEYLAGYNVLFAVGLVTSFLTGFYLMRAYCLTFTGPLKVDAPPSRHVHEPSAFMLVPVRILAFLAMFGGFLGVVPAATPLLEQFLDEVDVDLPFPDAEAHFLVSNETWLSIAVAIAGVSLGYILYTRRYESASHPIMILKKAFYIDELYDILIVRPMNALGHFIVRFMEPVIFNGSVNAVARGTEWCASLLQRLQSGQIRNYSALMVIGVIFLLIYVAGVFT